MKIWKILDEYLMRPPALKTNRLPTFYPSAASTIDEISGEPIGACLRSNYYRCAGFSKSDPDSVWSQYVFGGGNLWEAWFADKMKGAGILLASGLKFQDLERYISGELDMVALDPETGKKVILECKTAWGYEAKKRLAGNRSVYPRPKDPNLLQSFLYLDQFKDEVDEVILFYFFRDDHTRVEFSITREVIGGKTYPRIETTWNGEPFVRIDKRVSMEGIYDRYKDLMDALKAAKLPPPDYEHIYSEERVEQLWEAGEIAKTKYGKWQTNPKKYPIGHFMCGQKNGTGYCSYRSLCAIDNESAFDTVTE